MTSILDSDCNEKAVLLDALRSCARRVGMYGTPQSAEEVAKHTLHIILSIEERCWSYCDTEEYWSSVARECGAVGGRFSGDEEAHQVERWWRWGDNEAAALRQVSHAFNVIWARISNECARMPATGGWIEYLISDKNGIIINPELLENILFTLMSLYCRNKASLFLEAYGGECKSVGGDSVRRLRDIGSDEEWNDRAPSEMPKFTTFSDVSRGIEEVVSRLTKSGVSL